MSEQVKAKIHVLGGKDLVARRKRIVELYLKGVPRPAIAERMGITVSPVNDAINLHYYGVKDPVAKGLKK